MAILYRKDDHNYRELFYFIDNLINGLQPDPLWFEIIGCGVDMAYW